MSGLVHSYLSLSKIKEALYAAREAMKAMPQSAKALKLVGDVHASNSSGREKVQLAKKLLQLYVIHNSKLILGLRCFTLKLDV